MPDQDFINLDHTVQTHEAELDRQSIDINALMEDLNVVIQCNPGLIDSSHTLKKVHPNSRRKTAH